MQVRATGRASRRAGAIGCPQDSQTPYVPSSTRSSAASTSARWRARLLDQRADLGALEGDRRALGVVLVVGVGVGGGLDDPGVVADQAGEPLLGAPALLVQGPHRVPGGHVTGAAARRLSAMIRRWISEVPSKILVSRASRQ